MSLTPLDESNREPREGGRSTDDRTDDSPGLLQRVKGAVGRVVAALSGGTDSRETTVEPDTSRGRGGGETGERDSSGPSAALEARTAERSLTWTDDPENDRPSGDVQVDRPELVANWDDRGLTLSEPDVDDASISSDTWTDVER